MRTAYIEFKANGLDGYEDMAELWAENGVWKYYLHHPEPEGDDVEGTSKRFDSAIAVIATWAEEQFGVVI